jgi:hypothetical protein
MSCRALMRRASKVRGGGSTPRPPWFVHCLKLDWVFPQAAACRPVTAAQWQQQLRLPADRCCWCCPAAVVLLLSYGCLATAVLLPPAGSGIIYSASGSELSVDKAAVGQQLDLLHRLERSRAGDAPPEGEGEGVGGAAAGVAAVKPEELQDLGAVAKGAWVRGGGGE